MALVRTDDRASADPESAAELRLCPLAARTRALMARFELHAVKSRGQNFLLESNVAEGLVAALGLDASCGCVEVGAGLGALTVPLTQAAGRVVAYEVDRHLAATLRWLLADVANIDIRAEDFLKADLAEACGKIGAPERWVAIGNLPYYITTPLLEKLLGAGHHGGPAFERIVVTMQAEVGERILASPGGKEYGLLTLFCQYHAADIRRLFRIGPGAFLPRPKVDSLALVITPRKSPPAEIAAPHVFFAVTGAAFRHRRKTLSRALKTGLAEVAAEQVDVAAALAEARIAPERRAETLSFAEFATLSNAVARVAGDAFADRRAGSDGILGETEDS